MLKTTLAKYRHQPCYELGFSYDPGIALDQEFCSELEDSLYKLGGCWERLPATKETYKRIPEFSGLYMFVWNPFFRLRSESNYFNTRRILYVGKSNTPSMTLKTRYRSEYSKITGDDYAVHWVMEKPKNRNDRLTKYLNLDDLEYWFLTSECVNEEIDRLEIDLIKLFNPPANLHGRSKAIRVKPLKSKDAF